MNSRYLEGLLKSGELHRVARSCQTQEEFATRLGTTSSAITNARKRMADRGVVLPLFAELRHQALQDFEAEEGTEPGTPIAVEAAPIAGSIEIEADFTGAPQPILPQHHRLRGVSTLIDPDGNIKQQWIKTSAQNENRQAWLDAIRELAADLPRIEPAPAPEHSNDDLLAVYPVGDPHIGMLGWHEDAGENFNLELAEQGIVGAFQHLTALAPAAAEALLIFIGDNTHADGQTNTTTKGTRVDVDGRTVKMARTAIRTGRRAVDLVLAKHGRARMIWESGNHDALISVMCALAFSLLYENEPRVTVDVSPELFHWFHFGKNLIGTHHGDKVKPEQLMGVMAVDQAELWSKCPHRRFYCGHYHHQIVKEVPGVIVEYLPTLAGSDAWHRGMGYRSGRAMYMDVFHREHGHINRHIVGIDRLRGVA